MTQKDTNSNYYKAKGQGHLNIAPAALLVCEGHSDIDDINIVLEQASNYTCQLIKEFNTFDLEAIAFFMVCRDGAVVRALASHQCDPRLIPRSGVKCGLSLLVLFSAPRGFLRVLRFPLSSKNQNLT